MGSLLIILPERQTLCCQKVSLLPLGTMTHCYLAVRASALPRPNMLLSLQNLPINPPHIFIKTFASNYTSSTATSSPATDVPLLLPGCLRSFFTRCWAGSKPACAESNTAHSGVGAI